MTTHVNKELDGSYTVREIASPSVVNTWDEYDFRLRFTRNERKAILAASKVNEDIEDFEAMLQTAGRTGTRILSNDPLLSEAMLALVDATLLTDARRKEILGIVD